MTSHTHSPASELRGSRTGLTLLTLSLSTLVFAWVGLSSVSAEASEPEPPAKATPDTAKTPPKKAPVPASTPAKKNAEKGEGDASKEVEPKKAAPSPPPPTTPAKTPSEKEGPKDGQDNKTQPQKTTDPAPAQPDKDAAGEKAGDDESDEDDAESDEDEGVIRDGGDGDEDDEEDSEDEQPEDRYTVRKGVTIEARRERVLDKAGSTNGITEDELNKAELDDPTQVLEVVPSVQSRGEDGYGLRPNIGIRGTASERSKKITLMEDGILFGPAPYSAPAAYYFPLMTRMIGLDVYKGPATLPYGPHTVGGALNLISRPVPYKLTLGADVAMGTDLYFKAHAFGGTTHFFDGTAGIGFLLEGTHLQTNGFKEIDGAPQDTTGFSRTELTAKIRLNSDLDQDVVHTFNTKFTWSREDSDETYLGLTDADFRADTYRRYAASHRDRMQWMRYAVQAAYTLEAGNLDLMESGQAPAPSTDPKDASSQEPKKDTLFWDFKVSATFYRHDFQRDWLKVSGFRNGPKIADVLANPTAGSNAIYYNILTGTDDSSTDDEAVLLTNNGRTFESMGGQLGLAATFVHGDFRHELQAGVRYHVDSIVRDHDGFYYQMRDRRLVRDGSDALALTDNEGSATAVSSFLRYGFRWRGLTLTPGIRIEAIDTTLTNLQTGEALDNSTTSVTAGVGAEYTFIDGFSALFGVHQGFSPVSPGQGAEVEPETSLNWEAGLRYRSPSSDTHAEAVFFFTDYTNLSGQCSFSSGCDPTALDSQFNAGAVEVMGVELSAGHTFRAGEVRLPLKLVYTFTHSAFQSDFTSESPELGKVSVGDALPYVPEHAFALNFGAGMERWDATMSLKVIGPMREAAGSSPDDPMTDLRVSLDLFGRVQILEWLQAYVKMENLFVREDIVSRRPFGARPNRPLSIQLGLKFDY